MVSILEACIPLVNDFEQDHDVVQQEYDYRGVNNDARVAQGVPAQVQAVALLVPLAAPVCTNFAFSYSHI